MATPPISANSPRWKTGQIAAVRIGGEATLKRVYYYPEEGKLILQPANAAFPPQSYSGEELNQTPSRAFCWALYTGCKETGSHFGGRFFRTSPLLCLVSSPAVWYNK